MANFPYAVILLCFNDIPQPDIPMSEFTDCVTGGTGGILDYWASVTWGNVDLEGCKVFGWWTMKYSFVHDSADPLKNGVHGRAAWIAEARRLAEVKGVDLSPYYDVIAVINGSGDGSEQGKDVACPMGGNWGQHNWRRCTKCRVLGYIDTSPTAPCAAGGNHDFSGSVSYSLAVNDSSFPGQSDWRLCRNCQTLNYAGNTSHACPAPGQKNHDYTGSGSYCVGFGTVSYHGENNWGWCNKCQGMVDNKPGAEGYPCAGKGDHDFTGSGNYTLVADYNQWYDTFLTHETGHTIGLAHSWYAPAPLLNQLEVEYGNPTDIMSSLGTYHFMGNNFPPAGPGLDAPNLDFLNYLPKSKIGTRLGDWELQALNAYTITTVAVTLVRGDITYWIEYRQPTDWDQAMPHAAVYINEVRNWKLCQNCQCLNNTSGPAGSCPKGGVHDNSGSPYYTPHRSALLGSSGNVLEGIGEWLCCSKCQCMTYGPNASSSRCAAGGNHDTQGSGACFFIDDPNADVGDTDFRWCTRCQSVFYSHNSLGLCPAGGPHAINANINFRVRQDLRHTFVLGDLSGNKGWVAGRVFVDKIRDLGIVVHSIDNTTQSATITVSDIQDGWKCCNKCQGIVLVVGPPSGACPAGGDHTFDLGGDLTLLHDVSSTLGQDQWKHCTRCNGLAFSGNSTGVCPAGGTHALSAGFNYRLLHDVEMPDTQKDWRWCSKCQRLAYAGSSNGVCPAGGAHDLTSSWNYNIVNVL